MTADQIITDLRARGVQLIADGSWLRCRPRSRLTEADLDTLREIKPAVLARLREERVASPVKVICHACNSTTFWRSIHGPIVCGVCHPPATPRLIEKWIGSSAEIE